MEDIWKDLATLPSDPLAAAATAAAAGGSVPPPSRLAHQEFLSTSWSASNLQSDNDGHSTKKAPNPVSLETALKIGTNFPKKRGSSSGCYKDGVDRKRKRLMKNRESAVRSRARRQAYTYHLEAKISLLKEENAELRNQQGKIIEQQVQEESRKLQRSLTAPF